VNTKQHDTTAMQEYPHNGLTYFLQDETFYTPDGVVIGYICSRGNSYIARLVDDNLENVKDGSSPGTGDVDMERGIDEPLDDLLAMFAVYQGSDRQENHA
jgi:hypothetical protein